MSRRREILDAALEAFGETGEVAIEEVRRRSGASIGSIYHHFGGKEGIDAALYLEILGDYQAGATRALERAAGGEEGVKGLVRHHLRWVGRNPERARFLLRGGGARAAAEADLADLNRDFAAALDGWVDRHPEIRPLPREVFYVVVIGPAQEAARLWLSGRLASLRKVESELAAAAWRAVRTD
ncbi:MAG TPA: TetR/AcrR family transcriptional regulator [Solirubrobacterales bacterium]|nr:TetR/AcrR family transcriptional regulator [Solirubrobacterales bacterium]